jgi:phosphocarrier protein
MSDRASVNVEIVNRLGLHARPAMALVDTASAFTSKVTITRGSQTVDAKSIMQIMMLAATKGTVLEVVAEGPDATAACQKIKELVARGFDEE